MLSFTTASSSYVRYSHLTELDGVSKFAVSWWMMIPTGAAPGAYARYIAHMDAADANGFSITTDNTTANAFIVSVGNASSPYHVYNPSGVSTNTWYHYLIQFDGTEAASIDRVRLYINNSLVSTSFVSGGFPSTVGTHTNYLALGAHSSLGAYATAQMQDLGIWAGSVLTSAQRAMLANRVAPLMVDPGNLVFNAPLIRSADDRLGRAGTTSNVTVGAHQRMFYRRSAQVSYGALTASTPGDGVNVIMF